MNPALLLSLGLLSTPADAGTVKKTKSDAWYCEKSDGDIVHFTPYGRVPTQAEQKACIDADGTVGQG